MSPISLRLFAALLSGAVVAAPSESAMKAAGEYTNAHGGLSMLVACDGKTIFEQYDNGGAVDIPQKLASGAKSFVGAAAIAAVQDGLIQLDRPAAEAITVW